MTAQRRWARNADVLRNPSAVFALVGAAAVAVYFILPSGGLAQGVVAVGMTTTTTVVFAVRVRHLRTWSWRVLLGSQVLYCVAFASWYLLPTGFDVMVPYPSALDPTFWLAYTGWLIFLSTTTRGRSSDRSAQLDAFGAAVAVGIVGWAVLLEPALHAADVSVAVRTTSTIYPLFAMLLAIVGLRMVMTRSKIAIVEVLLIIWLVGELVSDVWFSIASADGTFRYGHPGMAGWLVSYVAFGAIVLHPDAARLGQPVDHERLASSRTRSLMSAGYATAAVIALALHETHGVTERTAFAAAAVLLVLLLVSRVALASRDLRLERDLRERVEQLVSDLTHAASHDGLTGLANRRSFDERLLPALKRRRPPGRSAVVLLIDIDAFKSINDTYGHAVGDALLVVIGNRLAGIAREADVVARLGGDEFGLVIDDADVRTGLSIADRVVSTINEPVTLHGITVASRASVGVHVPDPDSTPTDAVARADAAMYSAKKSGGGIELYDPSRHRRFLERFQLELELRAAPLRGGLAVHYQPIVDLTTRKVVEVEALLRWEHPTRGVLPPLEFIDVAEESGAIVEIGRWVFRQSCADCAAWQGEPGGAGVGVAINVSQRQLHSSTLVDDVRASIDDCGVAGVLVSLEVTETSLMQDTDEMVEMLNRLRGLGIRVAMDDFGTGYSSLAHLRALPVEVLKIDKAFVDGIAKEDEEWALASAIIRLATSLGKRTLAEGIEHASQLAHLRSLGCELGQGWLFAKAMPLPELLEFLARGVDASVKMRDVSA